MTRRRLAPLGLLPAVALALAWLLVPAQAAAGGACHSGVAMPPAEDLATDEVKLAPCAFSPTVARIPVGGTVTFANGDIVHIVTGANQAWGESLTEVQPHATVKYTFDEPGIYPYACVLHPGMSGAIVVGDVADTAAAAAPPEATDPAPPAGPDPVPVVGALIALVAGLVGAVLLVTARRRTSAAPDGPVPAEPVVR